MVGSTVLDNETAMALLQSIQQRQTISFEMNGREQRFETYKRWFERHRGEKDMPKRRMSMSQFIRYELANGNWVTE